tara:strand:- start:34 stop:603 length:570 start_codon:yes stop_codon:yes gene_type:complete
MNTFDINQQIFHIDFFLWGFLKKINNDNLKKICIKNYKKRMSKVETLSRNEDIIIPKTKEINLIVNQFKEIIKTKFQKKVVLRDFWTQVHKQNESSVLHNHLTIDSLRDSVDLACVYYVSVPKESGKLVLEYYPHRFLKKHWVFPPEENKYIIFSSGIDHKVSKNNSVHPRVSIAMNFKFIENNKNEYI